MKMLEQLRGTGVVTVPNGNEVRANYDLQITQDDPVQLPPITRSKHVSGLVWSECDPYFVPAHIREIMTLRMEDGRKLNFFHRDIDGSIGLSRWIG